MEYAFYIFGLLYNSCLSLFGDVDSLFSSYINLLLLHAALELIVSIRHRLRPQVSNFLYNTASALIIIAVANVTGCAVHLQSLRFLAYSYYILHEADCIFSLLEKENHATPPKISDIISRKAKKSKKNRDLAK